MTAASGRTSFGAAASGTSDRRNGEASATRAATRPRAPSEAFHANRTAIRRSAAGMIVSATHSGRPKERTFPCSRSARTRPTLAQARTAQTAAATEKAKRRARRRARPLPRSSAVESVRCVPSRVARRPPTKAVQSVTSWRIEPAPGTWKPPSGRPRASTRGRTVATASAATRSPCSLRRRTAPAVHFFGAVAFFAR